MTVSLLPVMKKPSPSIMQSRPKPVGLKVPSVMFRSMEPTLQP